MDALMIVLFTVVGFLGGALATEFFHVMADQCIEDQS